MATLCLHELREELRIVFDKAASHKNHLRVVRRDRGADCDVDPDVEAIERGGVAGPLCAKVRRPCRHTLQAAALPARTGFAIVEDGDVAELSSAVPVTTNHDSATHHTHRQPGAKVEVDDIGH